MSRWKIAEWIAGAALRTVMWYAPLHYGHHRRALCRHLSIRRLLVSRLRRSPSAVAPPCASQVRSTCVVHRGGEAPLLMACRTSAHGHHAAQRLHVPNGVYAHFSGHPRLRNTAAPKGARNLTIQVNGKARTYVLFVPNGYDPKKSIPLIFAWHSSGAYGAESRRYYKLEPVTGDGAIIVYPDGLNGAWDLSANGVDMKFFDLLLESISKDYCVYQARVFSTGYSFGGMMSHSLACDRGSKLRAFAPMAGAFFDGTKSCPTPVPAALLTQAMTPQSALRRARLREISGSKPMAAARRRCRPPPARALPTSVPKRQ